MSCSSTRPAVTATAENSDINNNRVPADWINTYAPPTPASANPNGFKECLPNSGAGFTRDSEGTYSPKDANKNPTGLATHISALLAYKYPVSGQDSAGNTLVDSTNPDLNASANNFPRTVINPALAYSQSAAKLRSNIQDEYCYYYNRYISLLRFILTVNTNPYVKQEYLVTFQTGTNRYTEYAQRYQDALQTTKTINYKLNDLLLIMQQLSITRNTQLSTYYGLDSAGNPTLGINQVNDDLEKIRLKLQADSSKLKGNLLKTDIQSAMMEYTIEKNQSSRNLLAIYGFMNIVAVGMLYYLYRNGK
jgi:hypothetical protein